MGRAYLILASLLISCQTPVKNEAVSKQEQLLESQQAMVRNALDSGKPESAMASLRPLLREHPNDAGLRNLMGMAQLGLRNPTRAAKEFGRAYQLDKKIGTGLNLSAAWLETGDYQRAQTLLMELSERAEGEAYPYKERIFHNLGYLFVLKKQLPQAESWLQQSLEENPTYFPALLEMARLYQRTKRPALAITAYRRSIDYCLICLEPVQALTSLYVKGGRSDEARRLLIQYGKLEGIAPEDRVKAGHLLNQITLSSLPQRKVAR